MRVAALALALLWGGAAAAQDVAVRGGEHDDFSRLVLRVPEGASWSLAPAPGGYDLQLPPLVTFDVSRAFDKIPRNRVSMLTPWGAGRLRLSVPCDCHAQAYLFSDVDLVVDVIDGPPPLGGMAPGARSSASPTSMSLLPLVTETMPLVPVLAPLAGPDAQGGAEVVHSEAERVDQTRMAVLHGLADAATQGFLDVAPSRQMPEVGHDSTVPPAPAPGNHSVMRPEPTGTSPRRTLPTNDQDEPRGPARPGVAFRTGAYVEPTTPALGATGTSCLPDETFDLAAWAGGGKFEVEIPHRTAQLTDGRDRLDPEGVEALARAYLAFGFGREAITVLAMDRAASRERDILRMIARVVDNEPVPSGTLDNQSKCLGSVTLWRALARRSISATDDRERTAMTMALRALPVEVRSLLAPRLAGLFLDEGDAHAAQEIAALAEHAGTEVQITQAAIAEEIEGPGSALAGLEALAETDPRMTPAAMVDLIDLAIKEGRPVPEDTLELARALRFEVGGEAARALLLAEARALTADRRFDDALALLDDERRLHPAADLDAALSVTVAALAEQLDDASFLELALGQLPDDLPSAAAEVAARRLEDLGFPQEAQAMRAPGPVTGGIVQREPPLASPGLSVAPPHDGTSPDRPQHPQNEAEPPLEARTAAETHSSDEPQEGEGAAATAPSMESRAGRPRLSALPPLPGTARPSPSAETSGQVATIMPPGSLTPPDRAATPPLPRLMAPLAPEAVANPAPEVDPPSDAVPAAGSRPAAALTETQVTLAERRRLLGQAQEVRARAAALLSQPPLE